MRPEQVGQSLHSVHPESACPGAEMGIQELRGGARRVAPSCRQTQKHVVHFYKRCMTQKETTVELTNIFDVKKVVDMFLEQTNQKLAADDGADAISGATDGGESDASANNEADSTSAASE